MVLAVFCFNGRITNPYSETRYINQTPSPPVAASINRIPVLTNKVFSPYVFDINR